MPIFKWSSLNEPIRPFKSKRELRAEVSKWMFAAEFEASEASRLAEELSETDREIEHLVGVIEMGNATIKALSDAELKLTDQVTIQANNARIAREIEDAQEVIINDLHTRIAHMLIGHEQGSAKRCKKCNCNAPCTTVKIARGEGQ